jgi:hypothetical protein
VAPDSASPVVTMIDHSALALTGKCLIVSAGDTLLTERTW